MEADPPTDKTKAIRAMTEQLQDVTVTVQAIKAILEAERAEKISRKQALYRILKESIALFFPNGGEHKK